MAVGGNDGEQTAKKDEPDFCEGRQLHPRFELTQLWHNGFWRALPRHIENFPTFASAFISPGEVLALSKSSRRKSPSLSHASISETLLPRPFWRCEKRR